MEKMIEMMLKLAEEKQYRRLKELLAEMNEVDIAAFIDELDSEKAVVVFRILPKELAADVFACLSVEKQQHIITSITDREVATIIEDLFVDDAVDMLEELPATVVKKVLQNANPDTRALINQFLNYPDNSAGSIMTAEYVGLKKTMTVKEAFDYIRRHGVDKETIYTSYVMNEARQLEGVVTVRDLLMNTYETVIGDIMDTHVIKAVTTDDQEEVADCFQKYGLLNLPVVDHENRLVGIVTVDDIVDVIEQEATEDFEKMAAMAPSERPYLKTGVFQLAKNRIFWLLVLMISSLITGGILAKYENAFAVLPLLVTFIPMLTDTGGNAGSQSSTLIIRGMGGGRDRACGRVQGGVEGAARGHPGGSCAGGGKFCAAFDPLPRPAPGLRHRGGQPDGHCDSGENHRLYAADGGQGSAHGPGHHGGSAHHHHRGRLKPGDLFPAGLRAAGTVGAGLHKRRAATESDIPSAALFSMETKRCAHIPGGLCPALYPGFQASCLPSASPLM